MLVWSQQYRIINSIFYSFMNNKTTFIKTNERIQEIDKIFLSPSKFETYTTTDFKFLVIWSCFNNITNKIYLLKHLQGLSKEELNIIKTEKHKIINYKTTLEDDLAILNLYNLDLSILMKLFFEKKISVIGTYMYLSKTTEEPKTRVQKKFIDRINTFMNFFEKIKEDLN